jgi:hypothetical protein
MVILKRICRTNGDKSAHVDSRVTPGRMHNVSAIDRTVSTLVRNLKRQHQPTMTKEAVENC